MSTTKTSPLAKVATKAVGNDAPVAAPAPVATPVAAMVTAAPANRFAGAEKAIQRAKSSHGRLRAHYADKMVALPKLGEGMDKATLDALTKEEQVTIREIDAILRAARVLGIPF